LGGGSALCFHCFRLATAQLIFCQTRYQFRLKGLDAATELVGSLIDIFMNEPFECRTIGRALSFNHRSNSSCHLLESRCDSGFGDVTFLFVGRKAGVELANWLHDASVEECLQSGDDVPSSSDGRSCHVDHGIHGDIVSAVGGRVDLPNVDSSLAMEQR